jgi:hypothetical protein
MAVPFRSTRDLKNDVLFRAGEPQNGSSKWEPRAIDYLNRVYRSLCTGASEFLPEFITDWWWLRSKGTMYLSPTINVGTVLLTRGSSTIQFSQSLSPTLDVFALDTDSLLDPTQLTDVTGWRFMVDSEPDSFLISSFDKLNSTADLDMPYTGPTNIAAGYRLMKDTYKLDSGVAAVIGPMVSYRGNLTISGMSGPEFDRRWPLSYFVDGAPTAFCLEDEQTVRFNAGGMRDTYMRLEFRYRPVPETLSDTDDSIPLVPIQYRHLLSDMALVYVFMDKNDDRAAGANASARSGLAAMVKENQRRLIQIDRNVGSLFNSSGRGPLQTESGLVFPRFNY